MMNPESVTRKWYGKLETPEFSTPVIFDPNLPGMPTGQVYLYNSQRDAIVPYQWQTVQQYLRELDAQERQEVQRELGDRWRAVRRSYLKNRKRALSAARKTMQQH